MFAVGHIWILLLLAAWLAVIVGGAAFWLVKLVEVCSIPDSQFQVAGSNKVFWIVVLALTGWVGALIWQFGKRATVRRAAGAPAPPGWYSDATGRFRWWDGLRWTDAQPPR